MYRAIVTILKVSHMEQYSEYDADGREHTRHQEIFEPDQVEYFDCYTKEEAELAAKTFAMGISSMSVGVRRKVSWRIEEVK